MLSMCLGIKEIGILYIPYALFAYRTSIHESTQETPFFLMHGRQPVLPIEAALCPPTLSYSSAEYYKEETNQRLQEAFTLVKSNTQKTQQRQKEYNDRNSSDVD